MLVQMLHMLQRKRSNCTLVVTAPSQDMDGYLYVQEGDVIAAAFDDLTGIDAATTMIAWEEPEIAVYSLPQRVVVNMPLEARSEWFHTDIQLDVAAANDLLHAADHSTPAAAPERTIEYVLAPDSSIDDTAAHTVYESVPQRSKEQEYVMAQVQDALQAMMAIDGAISVALVDWTSGMALGSISNGFNTEVAAAGNANVMRAKKNVLRDLGLGDRIEDILVTLDNQYHLIRSLTSNQNFFMYVVLNRDQGNLAMARYQLSQIEQTLMV